MTQQNLKITVLRYKTQETITKQISNPKFQILKPRVFDYCLLNIGFCLFRQLANCFLVIGY